MRATADPGYRRAGADRGLTHGEGRRAFARLTKEVARTGGRDQGWHHLAVVVGDEIVAFPEIDFDVYPDGFPDAAGDPVPRASDADAASWRSG